jgi:hypothetical protein
MNHLLDNREQNSRLGYLLLGIGILFLANQWFGFNLSGILWPFFVIAPGAAFLYIAVTGDKSKAGFAFPGAIITGTGAILLVQSLTGHWESWAYIWALYPAFVGMALQFHGRRVGKQKDIDTGREMTRWSMTALAIGFVFFELMIFGNFGGLALWLVLGGILLLVMGRNGATEKRKHDEQELI